MFSGVVSANVPHTLLNHAETTKSIVFDSHHRSTQQELRL